MRVLASELKSHIGEVVELKGWVHRVRELGAVSFVMLRDRSGIVQVVVEGKVDLTLESVVAARGLAAENPKAASAPGVPGGVELRADTLEVLAAAAPDLPYPVNGDPEKVGLDIILDSRPLALRNPKLRAIFAVQSTIVRAFSEYLACQDFTEVKTSKLIGTGTEGGTGLFEVDYFDTKVYLAQSPQFYKQTMVSSGMERVYEVAPAYRAEKHDTPRHLNEYVSLDLEMAFIDSELELIDLEKRLLAHIFARVAERNGTELEMWKASVPSAEAVAASPVIAHDEARDIASRECGKKLYDINPRSRARPVRVVDARTWLRPRLRERIPAQGPPLLRLPQRSLSHDELRRPVPRPRDNHRGQADQRLRHAPRQSRQVRPLREGHGGLHVDLQVRLPAPRRLRHRLRAADAEDPRADEREGGEPVPAGQEEGTTLNLTESLP